MFAVLCSCTACNSATKEKCYEICITQFFANSKIAQPWQEALPDTEAKMILREPILQGNE